MKQPALVVLSGGQDSTTCLFWAKKFFTEVYALGFDYGQRHKAELACAAEICKDASVPFEVLALPLLNTLSQNALTRPEFAVDTNYTGDAPPNTLVEGRNLLFLSYAAVYAKARGIKNIVTGVGETDFSGYPDCREVFIKSLNVTLNLGMDYDFTLHTPLMRLTKAETWQLAEDLGVLEIIRDKTLTCYNGIKGGGCGACPACKLRSNGYNEFLKNKNS